MGSIKPSYDQKRSEFEIKNKIFQDHTGAEKDEEEGLRSEENGAD